MIMIIILRPFMIRSDTIYHILLEHVLVLVYSTVCTCVRYKIIYIYKASLIRAGLQVEKTMQKQMQ